MKRKVIYVSWIPLTEKVSRDWYIDYLISKEIYPNLVGDVRTLPLKSAADHALHDLSCLVILVLLFQQDFGPCTVHVKLLVRDEPRISISQSWKKQEEQPILGRHLEPDAQLLQGCVGLTALLFRHRTKLKE